MATENEKVIIDVVPDLDTRKFVQEYIEFGKDLKKLAKTIEGFLTQELKVNIKDLDEDGVAALQKQVTAISKNIIAEAKRMEREEKAIRKKEKAEKLKDIKAAAKYELDTSAEIGKANIKRIRQRVDAEASARLATEKAEADYFHRVHVVLAKRRQKLEDDRLLNLVKDKDAEAKMLLAFNKEQTDTELAELRQRIKTKHTYRKAEIAKIRADRKAEDAWFAEQDKLRIKQESSIFKLAPSNKVSTSKTGEYQYFGMPSAAELQKAKTDLSEYTAKSKYAINSIKEAYKEAKTSINTQGTLLDPKKINDDILRNVKAFKKAYTTGVFAWTPDEQQALDKFWKIKREQEVKEAIAAGKLTGKAQATATETARTEAERLSKQKAPIGAFGVQTQASGAFSSLATKQTYNSASDFKANLAMEATARAAIVQSAKLGKQAAHEFNNSFLGSFMSGSSFGHKIGTTLQYTMAGTGIFAAAAAITSVKDAVVEADKALGMFRGVLEMSDSQAKALQSSIFDIGKTFGGTTQDLNDAALALGRAGVAGSELKDSITAVSQMALVSGESLQVVTDLFVSWRTLYPEKPIDELANSMTAAANATKATIPDLATASNYLLTAGSQAGMTADALLAMEASLIQIGKSASTSGTEGRRFFEQISRGSDEVKKAWFELGINVDTLSDELAKGGAHAEAAMLKFYETIGKKSKGQVQDAVKGIKDVLDVATIQGQYAISQANIGFKEVLEETKKNTNALKNASDTVALTYEKMFERIVVAGKESAVSFEKGIVSGFGGGTVEEFNKNIKVFSENASKATEGIGRIIGVLLKGIDVLVRNINVIGETVLFTGLAYGTVAAVTGVSALSTAIAGLTAKQWLLNTAMNANPLGLVVTTAFAAATALEYFGSKTVDALNKIANNNALKNFKKDLDLINLAVGPEAQLEVIKYLELAKIKQLNDSAKKYNEAAGWFNATMSDEKKNLLAINKAHAEELKHLRAKKEELKALQKVQKTKQELAKVNTPDLGAGPLNLSDKDSGKAAREAQRKAQDALDAEIQGIREKYAIIERNEAQLGKLTSERKKEIEILESYEKYVATQKAKHIDDYTEKVRKAHVEALDKEQALYTEVHKNNIEAANKLRTAEAQLAIDKAISNEQKVRAKYIKDMADAENEYNSNVAEGNKRAKELYDIKKASAEAELRSGVYAARESSARKVAELTQQQLNAENELFRLKSSIVGVSDVNAFNNEADFKLKQDILKLEQDTASALVETQGIRFDSHEIEVLLGEKSAELAFEKLRIERLTQEEKKKGRKLTEDEIAVINKQIDSEKKKSKAIIATAIATKKAKEESTDLEKKMKAIGDAFNFSFKGLDDITNGLGDFFDSIKDVIKAQAEFSAITNATEEQKSKHLTNQIGLYAGVAGAASKMAKEGSKEAAALQVVETTLATIAGVRAILAQASNGDPYSAFARMAAMAAIVIPAVASIGGSINMMSGKSIPTNDRISGMAANTGTGTVLGSEDPSESIANSLSNLEDMAKPELKYSYQMVKLLTSIDSSIRGISSGIVKQGGYALGEGFTDSRSQRVSLNGLTDTVGTGLLMGATGLIGTALDKLFLDSGLSKALGTLANDALGFVFGTTEKKLVDYGLFFEAQRLTDDLQGYEYQTINTKKKTLGITTSNSNATKLYDLNEETSFQFDKVIDNLYNTTLLAGEALLGSTSLIEKNLSDFTLNLGKISFKKKTGEEIQELLTNVFSKAADEIATDAFIGMLDGFRGVGEGMFETMTRVASGMEEAQFYADKLGTGLIHFSMITDKSGDVAVEALQQTLEIFDEAVFGVDNGVSSIIENFSGTSEELYELYTALGNIRLQILATNQAFSGLTTDMIRGAGGIEQLSSGVSDYIEAFLTSQEQVTHQMTVMSNEFAKIGVEMPETNAEFRALVESLDLSTSSGQELYGQLMTLSGGFSELTSAVEQMVSRFNNAISQIQDASARVSGISNIKPLSSFADAVANVNIDTFEQLFADINEAYDAETAALQARVDNANNAISEARSASAEEQSRLQAEYDKTKNVIEGQIKALEEERDARIKAVNAAKDAQLKLYEALKKYVPVMEKINDILNVSSDTLSGLSSIVSGVTVGTALDYIKRLEDARDKEIDAIKKSVDAQLDVLNKQLDVAKKLKDVSDSLKEITKKLRDEAFGSTSGYAEANYRSLYDSIQAGLLAGNDVSGLISDFTKYADMYGESIRKLATTQGELAYNTLLLTGEIDSLDSLTSSGGNVDTIQNQIDSINNQSQIDTEAINAQFVSTISSLSDVLSSGLASAEAAAGVGFNEVENAINLLNETAQAQIDAITASFDAPLSTFTESLASLTKEFEEDSAMIAVNLERVLQPLGLELASAVEDQRVKQAELDALFLEFMSSMETSLEAQKDAFLASTQAELFADYLGGQSAVVQSIVNGANNIVKSITAQPSMVETLEGLKGEFGGTLSAKEATAAGLTQEQYDMLLSISKTSGLGSINDKDITTLVDTLKTEGAGIAGIVTPVDNTPAVSVDAEGKVTITAPDTSDVVDNVPKLSDKLSNTFGKDLTSKEAIAYGLSSVEFGILQAVNKSIGLGTSINSKDYDKLIAELKIQGYASGGYTGDIAANAIAGVVHGKEYVVNAQTTKDLGLNNSAGVFVDIMSTLRDLKNLTIKLVADNAKQLSTQRAIYSQGVA